MNYFKQLSLIVICLFSLEAIAQNTIFVKPGGQGNGSSWAAAFGNLQTALTNASPNNQIWVAAGTYKPTDCEFCDENSRSIAFEIPADIHVYGGFNGTETQLTQRNPLINTTILSGDIGNINNESDNSYTIAFFSNSSSNTRLDGFTLTKGNANGANASNFQIRQKGGAIFTQGFQGICQPTIANCQFIDNFSTNGGGALHNLAFNGSNFTQVENCVFDDNSSMNGGAIFNTGQLAECAPDFINCEFKNNLASSTGGCVYNFSTGNDAYIEGSYVNCLFYDNYGFSCAGVYALGSQGGIANIDIINCTFINNDANIGTAVYVNASDGGSTNIFINNSIIWNNTGNFDPIFHYSGDSNPQIHLNYSIVDGSNCNDLLNGVGNINCGANILYNQDPQLLNLAANDAHLNDSSPALDYGSNAIINPTGVSEDLDGNTRIYNGTVDLGVFEFDGGYIPPAISAQPSGGIFCEGATAQLSIGVSGSGPFSYQWFFNNTAIDNSNSPTLSISNLTTSDIGNYYCEVDGPQNESLISDIVVIDVQEIVAASVTISADATSICQNEIVTFTATPQNGGSSAFIQWLVNNQDSGATGPVFSSSNLSDGDLVTCTMFSSLNCVNPGTSLSNGITINVTANLTAELSISADNLSICEGEAITFTTDALNEGNNPIFQWTVNNIEVGANEPSLVLSNLNNNDEVKCTLTSSALCVQATDVISNSLIVSTALNLSPSISIQTNTPSICSGQIVSFNSTITNGGSAPSYLWQVNNVNTTITSPTFNSNQLNDNDIVKCILTSNANCLLTNSSTSNEIVLEVVDNLEVSASITASETAICQGENITFTAELNNQGLTPQTEWFVNNISVAQNTSTYNTSAINDGDIVTFQVISSLDCTTNAQANSNAIAIDVTPNVNAEITIETANTLLCENESATLVAVTNNEGINPTYEWYVNGIAQMNNQAFLLLTSVEDGAIVTANLQSSVTCLANEIATSNEISFEVVENLEVAIEITANDSTICEGTEVLFTSTANNQGLNPQYEWFLNGTSTGEENPFYQTTSLSDQDIVTCQIISSESCTNSNTQLSAPITLSVASIENVSIDLLATDMEICQGESATIEATTQNEGANPIYLWQLNQVDVGNNSSTLVVDNVDLDLYITCMVLAEGECLTNNPASADIDIIVNPLPEVSILSIDTLCHNAESFELTEGQPAGGIYSGDFIFDGIFAPSQAGEGAYSFEYEYTDENMCSNIAIGTIAVAICTNIKEIQGLELSVFPNPTSEVLYISGENTLGEALNIQLINKLGQVILTENYSTEQRSLNLNVNGLARGAYFLNISSSTDWSVYTIILN